MFVTVLFVLCLASREPSCEPVFQTNMLRGRLALSALLLTAAVLTAVGYALGTLSWGSAAVSIVFEIYLIPVVWLAVCRPRTPGRLSLWSRARRGVRSAWAYCRANRAAPEADESLLKTNVPEAGKARA